MHVDSETIITRLAKLAIRRDRRGAASQSPDLAAATNLGISADLAAWIQYHFRAYRLFVGYRTEIRSSKGYLRLHMEGSIYLERLNPVQASDPQFALSYIPYAKVERELEPLKFLEQESLRRFLVFSLALESSLVATALLALQETGSAEIEFLTVSDDDLRLFELN